MLRVNVKVTDVDSGWRRLLKTIKRAVTGIKEPQALVGIQANEDAKLLTIANVQEFGATIPVTPKMRAFFRGAFKISLKPTTTSITIPPRPFIRQTVDKREAELIDIGFDLGLLIIDGTMTVKSALEIWGDKLVSFMRSEIAEGNNFEPNAPLTIMNKGAGKHPLQDSGRLQQALKAVVTEA